MFERSTDFTFRHLLNLVINYNYNSISSQYLRREYLTKRKRGGFPLPLVFFKEFLFYILKSPRFVEGGIYFFWEEKEEEREGEARYEGRNLLRKEDLNERELNLTTLISRAK